MRKLRLSMEEIEEMYRRMIFNIMARNHDDHAKNIAFLMDRAGRWSLSPAYDLTFAYNPTGTWTQTHQLTVAGKRDGFEWEDLKECARAASLKRGRAEAIVGEVRQVVERWPDYADDAGVRPEHRDHISKVLHLAPLA